VDTKCRLKVGRLVEIVLKAFSKRMRVGSNEIRLHFRLADHAISDREQKPRLKRTLPGRQNLLCICYTCSLDTNTRTTDLSVACARLS